MAKTIDLIALLLRKIVVFIGILFLITIGVVYESQYCCFHRWKVHIVEKGVGPRFNIPVKSEDVCTYKSNSSEIDSFIIRRMENYNDYVMLKYGDILNDNSKKKILDGYSAIFVINGGLKEVYYKYLEYMNIWHHGGFDVEKRQEDIGKCKVYFIKVNDHYYF